ncbi:MAG: hypothetical protein KGD60_05800 [Candidatus Thorarchaeota archaeon]|nr:hypothetical protein [Candidatus Thorarchaeota archaeon]
MRNKAILLFLMFILVVSATDENAAPTNVIAREPLNFVLSQTEMPIYELVTPDVNETYVQSLASSLFGIHDVLAEEAEGVYFVNWGNSYLEVDSSDGSIWFADYDRLWNISLGDEIPTPTESQALAEAWLDENGLVPTNAAFANIGTTNATIFNPVTEEMHSKILHYHFNYDFVIPDIDIPIAEEAAQITVMIGESGDVPGPSENIVGFDWKWRNIKSEAYTNAVLIEFDSLLNAYGIPSSSVVEHQLMYDTGEEDSNNDLLYPVYEITLLETDDEGNDIHLNLKIDATEFAPQVVIVNPTSSITVKPGDTISFDSHIIFGTPPYQIIWKSDFDGVLSYADNFTISTLSEVFKKNIHVPHAISVTVVDSEDRWASDVIAVTIDQNAPMTIEIGVVLVALGAVVLLSSFLIIAKKKGSFVVLFLLMLVSAFLFLPITSAYSEVDNLPNFRPNAPTGAYDEGIKEVGIEWVGMTYEKFLFNAERCSEGFYNHMGSLGGYGQEFNWGEYSAWEEDFKDTSFGGNDSEWVDCVDFVYYQGHGGPNSVSFTSQHDSKWLQFYKLRLGDGDLETIAFDSCKVLAWEGSNGKHVFDRWGPVLRGVHQVCGFATNSINSAVTGEKFASYMTGLYPLPALTILDAWFRAAIETEGSDRKAAVFYGTNSTNPFQPQMDDPINDHAKGFGYVCSDPVPETIGWYVYIWTSC